jgi:hypothetical protein
VPLATPSALIIMPDHPLALTTSVLAVAPADLAGFLATAIIEALTLELPLLTMWNLIRTGRG